MPDLTFVCSTVYAACSLAVIAAGGGRLHTLRFDLWVGLTAACLIAVNAAAVHEWVRVALWVCCAWFNATALGAAYDPTRLRGGQ
jgi:hypothetical protein